jgi:hypothetical protein
MKEQLIRYAEIGKGLGIDEETLNSALDPYNFNALTADSLSIREMSRAISKTEGEVMSLRETLYSIGAVKRVLPNFAEDNILPLIENDQLTYDELARLTGKPVQELRACYVPYLKRKHKVETINIKNKRSCGARISCHKLFPKYAGKSIVYVIGDERKVAEKLAKDASAFLTVGKKKSINYFTRKFPSSIREPLLEEISNVPAKG